MKIDNLKVTLVVLSLVFMLIGCQTISNVQNIRQVASVTEIGETNELTLMTFNIRVGGGIKNFGTSPNSLSESKEAIQKIVDTIQYVSPDFVALQEVRSAGQAYRLAKNVNMNYAYIPHPGRTEWWGLAVLSKHKILQIKNRSVQSYRNALVSTVEINDNTVTFVNVHYHLGDYRSQVASTIRIIKNIEEPVVLLGDLNRSHDSTELKPIYAILNDTCKEVDTSVSKKVVRTGTFYGGMGKRIDYIFVAPKYFTTINVGVIPGVFAKSFKVATYPNKDKDYDYYKFNGASDHLAYFAKVKLK